MDRKNTFAFGACLATVMLTVAACGGAGSARSHADTAASGVRVVDVEMKDVAFASVPLRAKAGETVRFVFRNDGKIAHDAFIGDAAAQDAHEKEMRAMDKQMTAGGAMAAGMHHHDGGDAITVQPGRTGEITHTFKAGESAILGCHQSGHYLAGMKEPIVVTG